ncbi:hypothetical protein E8P82_06345 [Arthrobacter echini]|uniref:Uncharacterized protein n=1 Tax=Arthrobacter echini TaxID=1529066 RepID=A0A4S5E698_9MICC|nr:Cpe/LpqF family protein [Arthrobacter echini]THJ67058.1 hypothetical protein E8P82_06345 [Arthrobacter echini]
MRHHRYPMALIITASLLLSACSSETDSGESTTTPSAEPVGSASGAPSASTDTDPPTIPDSPVGMQVRWVLDQLAADDGPDEEEATERFAPEFLAEVPADELAATFDQLRALGPFVLETYQEHGPGAQGDLTGAAGQEYLLSISLDGEERIAALLISGLTPIPELSSIEDAPGALSEAGGRSAFLLAEVSEDGSTCRPVVEDGADQLLPIGSIFKLYVLGALVQAIDDGDLTWDEELTLTEDLKSLPSGTLQNEPAGTQVTVREAAEAMIAISDNTATDLLIDAVGRAAVERAVEAMGHGAPEVTMPFLTTREMFQLSYDPDLFEEWQSVTGEDPVNADPEVSAAQRELVESLPEWDLGIDPERAASVSWTAGLDWFATTQDLCAAHLYLQRIADTDAGAPVTDILGMNPGLSTSEGIEQVAFKGGSATGEIAGSWHIGTSDGTRYVLVMQVASRQGAAPDARWFFGVADQVVALALADR